MKQLHLLIIFTLLNLAMVASANANCYYEHLDDAIKINQQRKVMYRELSDSRSLSISNLLILGESLSKLVARYFDYKARPYRREGIPLFCDDFVSMELIPDFRNFDPNPDSIELYIRPNTYLMKKELRQAYKRGGFLALKKRVHQYYLDLSFTKTYHAMMKHVLESITHSAELAPDYILMAREKSLKNPKKLIWRFINGFIMSLSFAAILDHKAAPLQADGLLIITQDVPQILKD